MPVCFSVTVQQRILSSAPSSLPPYFAVLTGILWRALAPERWLSVFWLRVKRSKTWEPSRSKNPSSHGGLSGRKLLYGSSWDQKLLLWERCLENRRCPHEHEKKILHIRRSKRQLHDRHAKKEHNVRGFLEKHVFTAAESEMTRKATRETFNHYWHQFTSTHCVCKSKCQRVLSLPMNEH